MVSIFTKNLNKIDILERRNSVLVAVQVAIVVDTPRRGPTSKATRSRVLI